MFILIVSCFLYIFIHTQRLRFKTKYTNSNFYLMAVLATDPPNFANEGEVLLLVFYGKL